MAIKIPWQAFGKTPRTGDVWLGTRVDAWEKI